MTEDKYINSITLEYLLNPALHERLTNTKTSKLDTASNDIKFYRHRICQLTKDMCKGTYDNPQLKNSFLNYVSTIIYHLKHTDEKDILQSEYNDLNLHEKLACIPETDTEENINEILMKKPTSSQQNNSLDTFVKKINIEPVEKILPQKKVANLKDSTLKKKGVKKKISE